MRTTFPILTSYLITFLAAACGPGDELNHNADPEPKSKEEEKSKGEDTKTETETETPHAGPTLEAFPAKVVEALCSRTASCHQYESTAECEAVSRIDIVQIAASVKAGKIKYHADRVAACLDAMKQVTKCAWSELSTGKQDVGAACRAVFEGTIAIGKACSDDFDCVTHRCQVVDEKCDMQCCASTCVEDTTPTVKTAKIGESCDMASCEDGAYCQTDAKGTPTTCATQASPGEACTAFDGCKSPSFCQLNFQTGKGTCKLPAAHGTACSPSDLIPCDNLDDYCDDTSKVCTLQKLPGEACEGARPCVSYARCGESGTCAKRGAVGAACDPAIDGEDCLGSLDCVGMKCEFTPEIVCP